MGINILKEISERAKKIEYISTESNKELNFKDLFDDSTGEKAIEDPRIDKISNGIETILERMDNASEKASKNPTNEFELLIRSIISAYDYLRDKKGSFGEENVEVSEALEDVLKKFENDLKKSGVAIQNPINRQFDSDIHEKGGNDKNPALEENTITRVIKCGVMYNGQIIRKAKVAVVQNSRKSRVNSKIELQESWYGDSG